jgi:hypothetical protein
MTKGLLVSHNNKLHLHKKAITNPSIYNTQTYRNYRNLYNTVLRASKKQYFDQNLKLQAKNPKKLGIY